MASPTILPELPSGEIDAEDGASQTSPHNKRLIEETGVSLDRKDAQEIEQFVREFVVQGLVPWMERAVTEWNETVRELPYSHNTQADLMYSIAQVDDCHHDSFRLLGDSSALDTVLLPLLHPHTIGLPPSISLQLRLMGHRP
jgi:hypothetical protein